MGHYMGVGPHVSIQVQTKQQGSACCIRARPRVQMFTPLEAFELLCKVTLKV